MNQDTNILVVDDNLESLKVLTAVLREDCFRVRPARSGQIALAAAREQVPDLVILDICMPDMDGYQVCEMLRKDSGLSNVPVIFLSALEDEIDKVKAFDVGAQDYIAKPFNLLEVKARVQTQIAAKRYRDKMAEEICVANSKISNLNLELIESQRELLITLSDICESRSIETGNHTHRVAEYCKVLGQLSGLSSTDVDLLSQAAPLHDIGKIAIPDQILTKPGPLTDAETEIMRTHASLGYKMLSRSVRPMIRTAAQIAYEHHEHWDGQGYPRGLVGDAISFAGRAVAVADVFDALMSKRCYKASWTLDDTMEYFIEQKGLHFDPRIVDLLVQNKENFQAIFDKYSN